MRVPVHEIGLSLTSFRAGMAGVGTGPRRSSNGISSSKRDLLEEGETDETICSRRGWFPITHV